MGMSLDSPVFFQPISLTSCASNLFGRIIRSHLLFFLESNSILSPRQTSSRPERSTLYQILFFSQSILDEFNILGLSFRTTLVTIDFSKAYDSVWHLPFSTNLFRLASLLALLVGPDLSFLIGALAWFFKITKVVPFESVEVFRKDPFLLQYFSFSSSMIFLLHCLFRQLLFMLTI